jgi:hypothetical protein
MILTIGTPLIYITLQIGQPEKRQGILLGCASGSAVSYVWDRGRLDRGSQEESSSAVILRTFADSNGQVEDLGRCKIDQEPGVATIADGQQPMGLARIRLMKAEILLAGGTAGQGVVVG